MGWVHIGTIYLFRIGAEGFTHEQHDRIKEEIHNIEGLFRYEWSYSGHRFEIQAEGRELDTVEEAVEKAVAAATPVKGQEQAK